MNWLHHIDNQSFLDVNGFAVRTPGLHPLIVDYAKYGVALFAALLLIGLISTRRWPAVKVAAAGWAALGTVLAVAINQPVGHAVAESRPYDSFPHAMVLVSRTSDFAFPSDHAVMAGAVACGLFLVSRKLGVLAGIAALAMAFARVYVGAHYPWDVLAGLALGAAVVGTGWILLRRPLTWLATELRRHRFSAPLVGQGGSSPSAGLP